VTGGPPLAWVAEACTILLGPDASMEALARWLGKEPDAGTPMRVTAAAAALPAVQDVSIHGDDGVPRSLSAWYAQGDGPTVEEAEAVFGPSEEIIRSPDGPFRVAFTTLSSRWATCLVAGSTWDSPGEGRRLVEILLRRDPKEPSQGGCA
jgi:hypothetical protein